MKKKRGNPADNHQIQYKTRSDKGRRMSKGRDDQRRREMEDITRRSKKESEKINKP